ncbi:hypothetical protein IQ06DRAFT_347367 [Phaeosphaeriaceae sp. SRC1lsM3a]|nr:hypothetical protein IQ06DRAFT_347367 [Stagonospora sp. SRC1lsM3a]
MLFQSTVLLALASSTFALPAPEPKLVARAQIPAGGVNCDGATFSAQAIRDSIRNSRTPVVASNGKEYPDFFGNNKGSANGKVFPNIPDSSALYGQPLSDPAWTGGRAGIYRVVMNEGYNYVGTMIHTAGNNFKTCTPIVAEVVPPHVEPPTLPGKV